MPKVVFHKNGQTFEDEVKPSTNLVVRAGIKQFPYPNLRYECGMGKCSKCACRVIAGAEHLPPPNWKEKKQLGERLEQGYRLTCQIWLEHDIELIQDELPVESAAAASGATNALQASAPGNAQ
ncbi:2Fe-2S iron-sulfur cluster-binding protein [Cupriavidus sp. CuC1]|uniref:2Fe-2S iron-sulfur cluster-binding protein n=1 Tax=Cupriavidus TaxID=106589 RepID=UPI00296B3EB2|nr:2Fe-2S iron-sulfur cluster-binding protein [Cupriavidus sp. CV2]MDW3686901.1 2Fe-2S iron-sulfur cluster-binding protein [Cupriavidus sp. CV2]